MTHLPGERPSASPHLRLTPQEVKTLWEKGQYTPKGYLYHLVLAHRREEWAWKISNVSEFCREWGFVRRTFYKAKAALINEGLLSEEIEGSFELIAHRCAPPDTPVPHGSHPVPHGSHPVPHGSHPVPRGAHLSSETLSQQEVCDPTDLYRSSTATYTQGVSVENAVSDPEIVQTVVDDPNNGSTSIPQSQQNSNTNIENGAIVPVEDQYSAPPILAATKKYGVNIDDPKLRAAIEKHPERVERAIACLDEKQLTVKYPTRFLEKAILEDWRPEKNITPSEWGTWFNEAQKRGLVTASQQVNDVIQVLTRDGQWIPYETLRRMDWDELQAQLNPAPEFVEETIKTVTMHPDHGQVLDINATAVTPDPPEPFGNRQQHTLNAASQHDPKRPTSPQEIAAKIKALGEAKSC